jgi:uncharacterized membrane protein
MTTDPSGSPDRPGAADRGAPPAPGWRHGAPRALVEAVQTVERSAALERAASTLDALVTPLRRRPALWGLLRGRPIGHALHPLLTDVPLGLWMATNCLDVFGGRRARPAATRLLALGMVAAVPTAVAGVAEWHGSAGAPRRVGVAHAMLSGSATALYGASLAARLADERRGAVALGLAGGVVATAGGYLGGHLSLVHGVGVGEPPETPAPGPGNRQGTG